MMFQFLSSPKRGQLGQQVLTLDGDFLLAVWHEKYLLDLQERCGFFGTKCRDSLID